MKETKLNSGLKESMVRMTTELDVASMESDVQARLRQDMITGLEAQLSATEERVKDLQASNKAAGEESARTIRFLEKENLELMVEIKGLKTKVVQVSPSTAVLSGFGPALTSDGSTSCSCRRRSRPCVPARGLSSASLRLPARRCPPTAHRSWLRPATWRHRWTAVPRIC
jgi:hypothetical protein